MEVEYGAVGAWCGIPAPPPPHTHTYTTHTHTAPPKALQSLPLGPLTRGSGTILRQACGPSPDSCCASNTIRLSAVTSSSTSASMLRRLAL